MWFFLDEKYKNNYDKKIKTITSRSETLKQYHAKGFCDGKDVQDLPGMLSALEDYLPEAKERHEAQLASFLGWVMSFLPWTKPFDARMNLAAKLAAFDLLAKNITHAYKKIMTEAQKKCPEPKSPMANRSESLLEISAKKSNRVQRSWGRLQGHGHGKNGCTLHQRWQMHHQPAGQHETSKTTIHTPGGRHAPWCLH